MCVSKCVIYCHMKLCYLDTPINSFLSFCLANMSTVALNIIVKTGEISENKVLNIVNVAL